MNAADVIVLIPLVVLVLLFGFFGFLSWVMKKEKKTKTPQKFNVGKCTLTMIFKDGQMFSQEFFGYVKWDTMVGDHFVKSFPRVIDAYSVAKKFLNEQGNWIPSPLENGVLVPACELKIKISGLEDHWVEQ